MVDSLPPRSIDAVHCPVCGYSLRDLVPDQPCPECGTGIEPDLLTSAAVTNAVAATKTWCLLGIVGWAIGGFGYWAYSMISLVVINSYYPGTHGPNQFAAVWFRTAIVIAPIARSCSWHRHARRNVYRIALRRAPNTATTPKRVIALSLPGILLGLLGLLGILAMLSAAR